MRFTTAINPEGACFKAGVVCRRRVKRCCMSWGSCWNLPSSTHNPMLCNIREFWRSPGDPFREVLLLLLLDSIGVLVDGLVLLLLSLPVAAEAAASAA